MASPNLYAGGPCIECGIAGGGHLAHCSYVNTAAGYPHKVKTNYSKATNSIEWDEVVEKVTAYVKKGEKLKPGDPIAPVGKKPTDLPEPGDYLPKGKYYYPGGIVDGPSPFVLEGGTKVVGNPDGGLTITGPLGSLTFPADKTYLPPSGQHDQLPTKYIGMDLNTPPAKYLHGLKPGQIVAQLHNGTWKPVGDLTGAKAMAEYQKFHPDQKVGQIVSHDWASQYVKIQTSTHVPENTAMALTYSQPSVSSVYTANYANPFPQAPANFPLKTHCKATFTWTTPDGTTHTMTADKVMVGQVFYENLNSGWSDSIKMDLMVLHPNGGGPMLTFNTSNPEQLQAENDPITALARDLFDTEAEGHPTDKWETKSPEVKKAYCKRVGDFLDGKTENP